MTLIQVQKRLIYITIIFLHIQLERQANENPRQKRNRSWSSCREPSFSASGKETFPYVLRVVSEVLSSNGSTSMGSVCGSTLSLLDAGVPLKALVSGTAMGLIKEGKEIRILTDIQGIEDFLGDMDLSCWNEKGITLYK